MNYLGVSDYIWWNPSDRVPMNGVAPYMGLDLGVVDYQTDWGGISLCVFSNPNDKGVAWTKVAEDYSVELHVIYLSEDELSIAETYEVTIPPANIYCAGIKKISKYEFRVLVRDTANIPAGSTTYLSQWDFGVLNVSTSVWVLENTFNFEFATPGNIFFSHDSGFNENTRSGDFIAGFVEEASSGYGNMMNNQGGYFHLAGVIANFAEASFGIQKEMLMANYNFAHNGSWWSSPADNIAGGVVASHLGNGGFIVRAAIAIPYGSGPWDRHGTYWLAALGLYKYEWAGFDLSDKTLTPTTVQEITYDPVLTVDVFPGWPSYQSPPSGSGGAGLTDGFTSPANSFFLYCEYVASYHVEADNHYEVITSQSAYPMSAAAYGTPYPYKIDAHILTETGMEMQYMGFEKGHDNRIYLTDYIQHSMIPLIETGYDIKTAFNRLDSDTNNILCWAKRLSDNWYGIAIFSQGGVFQDFIPVSLFSNATYGSWAIIVNGFAFVGTHGYYIGGIPIRINEVEAILEMN
jgi:hypothetical protein